MRASGTDLKSKKARGGIGDTHGFTPPNQNIGSTFFPSTFAPIYHDLVSLAPAGSTVASKTAFTSFFQVSATSVFVSMRESLLSRIWLMALPIQSTVLSPTTGRLAKGAWGPPIMKRFWKPGTVMPCREVVSLYLLDREVIIHTTGRN